MPNILILGEAWGADEEKVRAAFVGYSGHELTRMLDEAGIHRADCFLTNVFNQHPPGNKIEHFCGGKDEAIPGYPALIKSKYVRQDFLPELQRLHDEIESVRPNIIVALGNTASWALLGRTAISKYRGTTEVSTHTAPGYKTLATYHPAAVCRQWELRPVTVLDLAKCLAESEFPDLQRPKREVWVEPTLEDLDEFERTHIRGCEILSVDIETAGDQITCIGFAPNGRVALVIPFADKRRKTRSYWDTYDAEREAWAFVKRILGLPCRKLFQNGLYDIAFLWRAYGIQAINANDDTMLLHHAIQPESRKSLGFLGSIYTRERHWKSMREEKDAKIDTIKGED